MRRFRFAMLMLAVAAAASAQSTQPSSPEPRAKRAAAPAPAPATQPAVAHGQRPTPMLSAMLASRAVAAVRPPLRRGVVANTPPISPRDAGAILRARVAATRGATSQPIAIAPAPRPVTIAIDGKRAATRPVIEPTRLKLDVDAPTGPDAARLLGAAFGQTVRLQREAGLTFHGRPATFAAAVAEFFETGGMTVSEQYSELMLVAGKPLRVVNLNDVGVLVLTRITLSARRAMSSDSSSSYDYTINGVFVPDPAMGVLGVTADGGVSVTPGVDRGRSYSPNIFQNMSGFRVNLSFSSSVPLKKADTISGRVRGLRTLDVASADVSFDQIADGTAVEDSGLTVKISIPPQQGMGALRVTITGDKMATFQNYRWNQSVRQFVRVLDFDGGVMPTDVNLEQSDAKSSRLMVRSNLRASEFYDHLTTVRVRVPLTVKAIDLPFELKDVDLPGE